MKIEILGWKDEIIDGGRDKCTARVRVRDARRDDVKATTIKEKDNTCLLYMEMFPSQNPIKIFAQTPLMCPS